MNAAEPTNILLVDDRDENLLALRAILEPLGQQLVTARSGEEALKELLGRDFAVILLDVQMPGLDGFATAELIKQRPRTSHVPIIFLTAINKDERQVFRGYEAGAVDYLFKPFDPDVLRSKVSVFIDLYRKSEEIKRQSELLRRQELDRAIAEREERYRFLAESIPQQVWTATPDGGLDYVNERTTAYFGEPSDELLGWSWSRFLHPDDLEPCLARWQQSLDTGDPYEIEFRLCRADGSFRWHLGRAVALRDEQGNIAGWFGTNTDIHDHKRTEEGQRFLLQAGAVLGSSLDYRRTLTSVAALAVPHIADWCTVDVVSEDGSIEQLAVAHVERTKVQFARELRRRYPPDPDSDRGAVHVIKSGTPELIEDISDEMIEAAARDELHLDLIRELGLRSYMCVPLRARDRTLGAITFVAAESGRRFERADLSLAEDLARRAAMAIENAELYAEAEARARAARVLASVGDGVFMLDADGVVRLWNPAAEAITGIAMAAAVGRRAADVIPGWDALAQRVPVASSPGPAASRSETVPVEIDGHELWLSIAGVGFEEGTVYAFRDLTEERALEQMKTDFVATVSHELRTPLAAIYGAALTMRRGDLALDDEMRDRLLNVIADESDRLASIVNDLLLASHLDSGRLELQIEACDAREIASAVVEGARTHLPDGVTVTLEAPDELSPVEADAGQLRQVLSNLVDNAVKYSPDGGPVTLELAPANGLVRFAVRDAGLGIPAGERDRIFEKFYRLDPNMTRGIGGTGLGLYICRELVRRLGGRIWVESREGTGSTFFVELPAAESATRRTEKRAPIATGTPEA